MKHIGSGVADTVSAAYDGVVSTAQTAYSGSLNTAKQSACGQQQRRVCTELAKNYLTAVSPSSSRQIFLVFLAG